MFFNIVPYLSSLKSPIFSFQILADVNERINPSSQTRRPSGSALDAAAGNGTLYQLSSQVAGMKMSKSLSGFLGDLLRPPPPAITVLNHAVAALPVETPIASDVIADKIVVE
jgi:hypothetical protein